MSDAPIAIVTEPLDVAAVVRAAAPPAGDVQNGAIVTFVGTVRGENAGRQVIALEYEAYVPLAVRVLGRIVEEAAVSWPSASLAIHHRIGRLGLGEASIVIAATAAHRAEAFSACRYAIERVKQIVPIWKREIFDGGETWLEGAAADPDDEAARREAYRRACA
jgi:molybdopterin synthase catalytic subunit